MPDIYIMCGIAGIISNDTSLISTVLLKKMTDAIAHRGTDGEGSWINPENHAGLGHRRLSIIDLSPAAAQPMHYLDRYTIIHNGEIYNYLELRERLNKCGYRFQSRSDTEVILAAYDQYGKDCVQYFDGMFAFAIWDDKERELFCARDRFGEKPFFYAFDQGRFLFASEAKALWAGGVEKKVNYPLLLNFLVLGHTETAADATITFFQDIYSLPPAHYIRVDAAGTITGLHKYWDCDKETKTITTERDAVEKFTELLNQSVKRRLRSDVALGTSLSGGLDSSSIVAMISKIQNTNTLSTFSAVFPGFEKDESAYIQELTRKFELKNYSVSPTGDELIDGLEKLCYHQEIPFTSSSVFAQYKVFELAKQHQVKVLLDGQGADETLGGYNRYIHWYLQELIGRRSMDFLSEKRALRKNGVSFAWGIKNILAAFFPAQATHQLEKREIGKLRNFPGIATAFRQSYLDPQTIIKPIVFKLNDALYFSTFQSGLEELLRYADRNSMANDREVRLPFLSHELVEFVFSLPAHFKIHQGDTKWILRKSMQVDLPSNIVRRKEKVGFEPPQKQWLENPRLQDYIHEAKSTLVKDGILDPGVLTKKIQPHSAYAVESYDWRYVVASVCLAI